ncbi:hypothetical protein VK792_18740 [Mesobacterium sp. TK19101]|uniref:Uncharacterized protein n=1 Tax=Mesobacterium hydrothermale TaxID=3111907 RepID=A0ABU6HNA5_9RHOB|nr:hypothetical protein [Mesobacterium sp. TK19101]MEC3863331.1 hypothetical protein [Mesobacterium sp. TK19101]
MDPIGKEEPYFGTGEQGASWMKWKHSQFAVRVADMPDDLGKLLGTGIEEYVRGR